jgi:hypothetical protein
MKSAIMERSSAPVTEVRSRMGATVPFDTIDSPGAYVCNWSGHLMRIPEHTLDPGDTLRLNIVGCEPLTVTKISDDPGVTLSKARTLAMAMGLRTGF